MGVLREEEMYKNYNINSFAEAEIKIKMVSSTEICAFLEFYAE